MAYKIRMAAGFAKDSKQFKNQESAKKQIKIWLESIIKNPEIGESLKGSWDGYKKVGFHSKPQIRIIYKVYACCTAEMKLTGECRFGEESEEDCDGLIDFIFVKTREECNNLYAESKKYAKGFSLE